ncbi:hypothetical protein [Chitinophaga sp. 212800010-3]|uniref:hypothetical protein n=1 Tax=unclassified Chitinophaga TaxID=2619133 RepID=UPI002DF45885|nr:hypothetical protein [Chitinophaga sp. 212800010-3]
MEMDLEHIRQLYLQQLCATLSSDEEIALAEAIRLPHIRRMCDELSELYHSPEMMKLLRERPTEKRWKELKELAQLSLETNEEIVLPGWKDVFVLSLLMIAAAYIFWKVL